MTFIFFSSFSPLFFLPTHYVIAPYSSFVSAASCALLLCCTSSLVRLKRAKLCWRRIFFFFFKFHFHKIYSLLPLFLLLLNFAGVLSVQVPRDGWRNVRADGEKNSPYATCKTGRRASVFSHAIGFSILFGLRSRSRAQFNGNGTKQQQHLFIEESKYYYYT